MLISTAVAVLLIAWCSIFLLDYGLRLKEFGPYVRLANRLGLEVSPFQLRLYFNWIDSKTIALTSEKKHDPKRNETRRVLLDIWFSIGAFISVICLLTITVYLTNQLFRDINYWMPSVRPKNSPPSFRGAGGEYRSIRDMLTSSSRPQQAPPPQEAPPPQIYPEQQQHHLMTDEDYDVLQGGQRDEGGLVPIIPGFNLPISHIPIFIGVLIVAAVFHELGHAWAALRNGIHVNGFGFFLIGIYPGAFTDIDNHSLKRSTLSQQLSVFGAGIWHNLVLSAVAYLLYSGSSVLLSPMFTTGHGVTVRAVDVRSALHAASGIRPGDVIVRLDDCHVTHPNDWIDCLRTVAAQRTGKCIEKQIVSSTTTNVIWLSNDEVHCCDEFNVSSVHVCFEREERVLIGRQLATKAPNLNSVLGVDGKRRKEKREVVTEKYATATKYSCLNARTVVEHVSCNVSTPCEQPDSQVCVYPALFNGTQLVRIKTKRAQTSVLFVGHVNEMIDLVEVDGRTARFSWARSHEWEDGVQLVAKYLFTLSLALALLNALPCYALDGQFIVGVLLRMSGFGTRKRNAIRSVVLTMGTLLLVMSIVMGFIRLLVTSA